MRPMLARTRVGLAAARATMAGPVVLVPTMGALHDGHRALLRLARELAAQGDTRGDQRDAPGGSVLVSIFVNPLQFGAGRGLRPLPADHRAGPGDLRRGGRQRGLRARRGREMYPAEPQVTVDPGPAGRLLEGEFRPGFFGGVLTVVLKLFQLTRPDIAVFGEKDAQQLALIRQMAADLDLGLRIAGAPIHRDPDGLATSSRNVYLSEWERAVGAGPPAGAGRGGRGGQRGARRRRWPRRRCCWTRPARATRRSSWTT